MGRQESQSNAKRRVRGTSIKRRRPWIRVFARLGQVLSFVTQLRVLALLVGFIATYHMLFGIFSTNPAEQDSEQIHSTRSILTASRYLGRRLAKRGTLRQTGREARGEEDSETTQRWELDSKPTKGSRLDLDNASVGVHHHASVKYLNTAESSHASATGDTVEVKLIDYPDRPVLYAWKSRKAGLENHIFNFGPKQDRVVSYAPACLDPESTKLIVFDTPTVCSGFNHSFDWWKKYCSFMESEFSRERALEFSEKETLEKMKDWEQDGHVQLVAGTTVLQKLLRDCGNIAHYGGRIFFLNHLLGNPNTYGLSRIDNVLLFPGEDVMKRFQKPESYSYWHKQVLEAIVLPGKVNYNTTLAEFLVSLKDEASENPRIHVLHSLSSSKIICFEHLLIPGFLKARFFLRDEEYPSKESSLKGAGHGTPSIPRDSLRLRKLTNQLLFGQAMIPLMRKKIAYIDRSASGRRNLDKVAAKEMFSLLTRKGEEQGYSFSVISFEGRDFKEQVSMIHDTAVAISVHGANLVNCVFQPPMAVLIELFPFGFSHKMYEEGGAAGLKYYSHTVEEGEEFDGLDRFTSREDCVAKDHDCKVHYRDAEMKLSASDLEKFEAILDNAFSYLKGLSG